MSMSARERGPAVAGAFYPADAAGLRRMVEGYLAVPPWSSSAIKAIVAPHAGYVYSGAVAGSIHAAVRPLADRVRRVVILGPAHRVGFRGMAGHSARAWVTPLGPVKVDADAMETARATEGVTIRDEVHEGEHSLEVQLPFIQIVFPGVPVVPLLVGDARPEDVERVLAALWGGPETLIVVSSDLSHFHEDKRARALDRATAGAIEAGDWEALNGEAACGFRPLQGLIRRALALDLRITARDLRTSADAGAGPDRVVGYGAFSFESAEEARLEEDERAALLAAARRGLLAAAEGRGAPIIDPTAYPAALRAHRRSFTTLEIAGALRGCIGSLEARRSLIEDVVANVRNSATTDPRFPPMTPDEAGRTLISVSILSHERPIDFVDESDLIAKLRPGRDGLVLRDGSSGALFLPSVWKTLPDPRDFLAQLKRKAGWLPDRRRATMVARRFVAESFSEVQRRV